MSAIRGRKNKTTEAVLASLLRRNHIWGWRRHLPLIGTPDFVFPKQRLILFADGCFWHGCPKDSHRIGNNAAFWRKKLAANKARDRRVTRTLRRMGWRVLRIWEHELVRKNEARLLKRIQLARQIR